MVGVGLVQYLLPPGRLIMHLLDHHALLDLVSAAL